jgi:cytochrome P450
VFEKIVNTLERMGAGSVEQELAGVQAEVMTFLDGLKAHLAQNPEPVFAVLRRVKPILVIKSKNIAIVTRFDDVQEVLSRDNVFQVTYGEKMRVVTGGNDFFLGMQDSSAYTRDVAHMRTAMRREDVADRVVPFVGKTAAALVDAADKQMDVVKQLSKTVPARWVGDYFGCPPTTDEELAAWASAIFRYLFTDLTNDPAVGQTARDAAQKVRDWLDSTIAARKATPSDNDDVLGRCLALQRAGVPGMGNIDIRNNLLGLLVGAIPTTSKCCAQALDQLFNRPEQLQGAQAAAQANDDGLVAKYVFEALRFNPNNPGVFRIAAEDYPLAKGQMHGVTIPKGTQVLAATQSAMFDSAKVDNPNDFRIDRPAWLDMQFGYGMHTCFGQYVNRVQIPGILKPLLRKPGLRRAGPLQVDGPFPSSLPVMWD